MEISIFIYMLIEAIIFLVPVAKLWFSVGAWKKEVDIKINNNASTVKELSDRIDNVNKTLLEVSNQLAVISAKVGLLIDNKIKKED